MKDLRSFRNYLGLRLIDVERASGVPASKISAAERGLMQLSPGDLLSVESFLKDRLQSEIALENETEVDRAAREVDEADADQATDALALARFHRENIVFRSGPIPPEVGDELARLIAQQKISFAKFQDALAAWADLKRQGQSNGNHRMLLSPSNVTVRE